ncbi:hypothetical protein MRB53_022891 [Persea americana]|uniref:Uncharacterized protein n=1 Tax=Persea americana TaxID=3435 RepID=A0ACC2L8S2_PERAE|nr:hypothetical protein MRB53_022891 [Persea americana]
MGQSMKKLAGKDDTQKKKDAVDKLYDKIKTKADKIGKGEFYHEIFTAVQEMNKSESGFQLNCPKEEELKRAFDKYHHGDQSLTKEEFEVIMKELAFKWEAKGMGAILLYIYGFPISAALIKQAVFPETVSDDVFIPLVTAASVVVLGMTKGL